MYNLPIVLCCSDAQSVKEKLLLFLSATIHETPSTLVKIIETEGSKTLGFAAHHINNVE